MNKKNLYLLGVFAVLVLSAYLIQGPLDNLQEKMSKIKNFLSELDVDGISHIDIESSEEKISLEKQGDKWLISGTKGFYVDDATIQSGLNGLKNAASADLEIVGENAEKKGEFETDQETGTLLRLRQGDDVRMELIVGKGTFDFQGSYISQPEMTETYLVKTNLDSLWNRSDWYDLNIFEIDKEAVNYLRFQYPNREFTLQKEDEVWQGAAPYIFSVDEDKVNEVLDVLVRLNAADIPAQSFEGTGLEKNLVIVQAKGEGIDQTIMLGDANEDGNVFAKKGDSDNIYLVSSSVKEALDKQIRDLR